MTMTTHRRQRSMKRAAAKQQKPSTDPIEALTKRVDELERKLNNPESAPAYIPYPLATSASRRTAGFKGYGDEWPIRLTPLA